MIPGSNASTKDGTNRFADTEYQENLLRSDGDSSHKQILNARSSVAKADQDGVVEVVGNVFFGVNAKPGVTRWNILFLFLQ